MFNNSKVTHLIALSSIFIAMFCIASEFHTAYSQPEKISESAQAGSAKAEATSLSLGIPSQVRFIALGIKSSREQLKNAQCTTDYRQSTPVNVQNYIASRVNDIQKKSTPIVKAADDMEFTEKAWWTYDSPRLSMTVKPDREQGNPKAYMQYTHLVANINTAAVLQKYNRTQGKEGQYYMGVISKKEDVLKNGLWSTYAHLDPRFYSHSAYSTVGFPLDEVLLEGKYPVEFKGEVTLNGSRCMKVELTRAPDYHELYSIDVEHGYLVRHVEIYSPVTGKRSPILEADIPTLTESEGVWLPKEVNIKQFIGGDKDFISQNIVISNFVANIEIVPSMFEVNWPNGTNVEDTINQKDYLSLVVEGSDFDLLREAKARQQSKLKAQQPEVAGNSKKQEVKP